MSDDPNARESLRMGRYLSGISMFTRGIAILSVLGSLMGIVAALQQRSSSDRLGFSLISLGILLIAVVVWSTATFHGTVARLVPLLAQIDEKLDVTLAAQVKAARRMSAQASGAAPSDAQPSAGQTASGLATPSPEPAPSPPADAAASGQPAPWDWPAPVDGGATESAAPGAGAESDAVAEAPAPPAGAASSETAGSNGGGASADDAAPAPAPSPPEPVRAPCPRCGGLIHPAAIRCVHCMQRVHRA